ncbi:MULTISPECIES: ATP-dependent Clp protease ATP-binding subunit [Rhodobacterales]|jgi:ATP-dependent Clp protease ATP-binding subunit ClpC|uniref:ATP-dependent Clp protease ATP-binding subunit ClpC n=3 Tax=Roseobacteraceae TaxID=2854170 RepID=A0A1X6YGC3_9RHOB|nr:MULTISPECIES: ATP-dependent Clp protease ATP-binding subunit [Roseobacteraceae]AJE47451.1 ATPase AAA [Celeribacter indicus]APZ51028.1 ATP-dependent Clp protease ATP-binding subunit ClpC [Salipiger abyssi]RKT34698.1 ATP-dependent Clp protease ATP-binding subunit ClpC [Roseovarius halotolerans]SDW07077.1 ATP-dependent Clp protease ATP-binding subunit ClpC [Celeribacter indicus]SLN20021.1 ATP-dependent Clp protease ATP-binding subunit ClpC [Roseovarius halotolerans]
MANGICDICKRRPASFRAQVSVNGERQVMELCDDDYRKLARQQRRSSSPLESLFGGGSLFDEFFGDSPLGGMDRRIGDESEGQRIPVNRGSRRGQGGASIADRLSEQGNKLLQEAAQKAGELGRSEVDTEHLLFALSHSDVVRTLLEQFKIDVDDLRRQIDKEAPRGEDKQDGEIGVSPRLKDALNRAFVASNELGHSYVGPEHLLIGLAEEGDGLAADILRKLGLTPQSLRQQVTKVVGQGAEEGRVETPSNTPDLDEFSRDLTKLARDGKLDPVIGRAREIETTIEVLARRKKNNPVLIGEPGVGKTAIIEGLAQRIVAGEVPEALRDKRLVELNINSMVAGSKYRGEFEERIQKVLKEIEANKDDLVLFIDELHTIMGAGQGGGEGGLDVANTFKPALARGELNLIGATTLNEYQKHIEKDAALERRFQPVYVDEPTVAQTIMILRGLRDTLESHHKVTITDEAIVAAAELSDRYVTGRFMPDKAIDLIDQAAARVKISATARPVDVQELEAETKQIQREQDYAAARKQFDRAGELKKELEEKQTELDALLETWKRDRASASAEVRTDHIAQIVSKLTGIPVTDLTTEEREKLLKLEDQLHERVIGQDQAIGAVADAVRLARAGLREGSAPTATFMFLGPTGVGKTELAKALAETVYGDEDAMIRIDMSEYGERHAVARLVGAPPGYVGYDEGGQLTERVRRRPYSVVLLDEIEKAHADVYNILLQVFDDGRLTDGKGRVVDFTNTIIIATSNLGSDIIQRNLKKRGTKEFDEGKQRGELMEVLRQHFRPEFINRIDEIIVFHSLNRPEIRRIVELQLDRVARTALGQGVEMAFDESVTDHFAAVGFQPEFGARELRRLIRSELETELARAMLSGSVEDGDKVRAAWSAEEQKITFEKQEVAEEDSAEPEDKPADTSGTADGDEDSEATDAKGESDASEEASAK